MNDLATVPTDQAADQLDFWLDAAWPMTEEQAGALAAAIGWALEADGWVYARGNDIPFQEVSGLSKRDKEVVAISFTLTGDVDEADRDAMDLVKDAYSGFVAAGRTRWGKPVMTRRGGVPAATWDLGDRGGIRIYYDSAVVATYVTPKDLELRKDLNQW